MSSPGARIGIRRECKNEWERRAPLTPDHVAELVENHGLEIAVQPSIHRAFPDKDYRLAGASIDDRLSDCRVIFGVKEIPAEEIEPGKTYLFFSHTAKGQLYNMPMLRRFLETGATLIDYEHVFDERGRRLIFFGRYAGYAGMIDALWALGRRLAAEGYRNLFERMRLAHDYSNLDEATHHVSRIGEAIRHTGIAKELSPVIFGFTGSGNVSRGAQEIFDRLPYLELDPDGLDEIRLDERRPRNLLYKVVFRREHRFRRIAGGPVDLQELERHPDRYGNGLSRWLRHLTVLIHGAFWRPPQPRLVSKRELEELWRGDARPRLRLIADISCDIGGGIEATLKATTPGNPVFVYDVERGEPVDGVHGDGPVVLAVDNLPCQLAVESSGHFGDTLIRVVPTLSRCAWDRPLDELALPPEIRNAIIAHGGKLTPRFARLERHLEEARS